MLTYFAADLAYPLAMTESDKIAILFICMGNICRSPLAEGVFLHKANQRGVADKFIVDSAGTGGWHVGELPDPRSRQIASKYGINLPSRSRQVSKKDLKRFIYLVCMDEENRESLLHIGIPDQRISLLLDADPNCQLREVPDPYYGGEDGFETIYKLIDSACDALLDELLTNSK